MYDLLLGVGVLSLLADRHLSLGWRRFSSMSGLCGGQLYFPHWALRSPNMNYKATCFLWLGWPRWGSTPAHRSRSPFSHWRGHPPPTGDPALASQVRRCGAAGAAGISEIPEWRPTASQRPSRPARGLDLLPTCCRARQDPARGGGLDRSLTAPYR